jgi:acyl dehydratase
VPESSRGLNEAKIYASLSELEAAVGLEHGPTDWFTMDQDRVDSFGDDTLDRQWIHIDTERAGRESPFGGTVAHGFLTLSLVPYFVNQLRRVEGTRFGVNYGLNKVRFPAPVAVGGRIRARTTMIEVERVGVDAAQVITRTTIEMEGSSKPACVADLVARYFFLAEQ